MEYINDISQDLAYRAFCGTSFSPEKRGESHRQDYARTMESDRETMRRHAEKGGAMDMLEDEFQQYREGYAKRYRAWLSSHAHCMSTMIAGPSNFPVRRAEKRNRNADSRMKELIDFRERAMKAAIRNLRPDLRPIMAGDSDAVERLQAEIDQAEKVQARMKEANAAIRKHAKAGHDAQVAALVALGFSETLSTKMLVPDWCNRIGFANYELTNNNANIRRMKMRLEQISKAKQTEATEIEGDGVRIEDCPADNRVRLFFDGKPDADIRAKLKSNGFRWSPTIGAWQAYRNARAMTVAREFMPAAT